MVSRVFRAKIVDMARTPRQMRRMTVEAVRCYIFTVTPHALSANTRQAAADALLVPEIKLIRSSTQMFLRQWWLQGQTLMRWRGGDAAQAR